MTFFFITAGVYLLVCTIAVIIIGYYALKNRDKS